MRIATPQPALRNIYNFPWEDYGNTYGYEELPRGLQEDLCGLGDELRGRVGIFIAGIFLISAGGSRLFGHEASNKYEEMNQIIDSLDAKLATLEQMPKEPKGAKALQLEAQIEASKRRIPLLYFEATRVPIYSNLAVGYGFATLAIGWAIACTGFWLWFAHVQVYLDRMVRAQAGSKNEPDGKFRYSRTADVIISLIVLLPGAMFVIAGSRFMFDALYLLDSYEPLVFKDS
ncbi:MAG: hypothetical protein ACR2HJ_11960 [Fimbriimonadales bacterium]